MNQDPSYQPFRYCIDLPQLNEDITSPLLVIQGWIAAEHPIGRPTLRNTGTYTRPLTLTSRPDVRAEYPDRHVLGFRHCVSLLDLSPEDCLQWSVHFSLASQEYSFPIPFSISSKAFEGADSQDLYSDFFTWGMDSPKLNDKVTSPWILLRGWVAADRPIQGPTLCNYSTYAHALSIESGRDVKAAYPHQYRVAFQHYLSVADLFLEESWLLYFFIDGREYSFPVTLSIAEESFGDLISQNQDKLPFIYSLDFPQLNDEIASHLTWIAGWIMSEHPIEQPTLRNSGTYARPLETVSRPDVEAIYPQHCVLGFRHYLSVTDLEPGESWFIQFFIQGQEYRLPLPLLISGKFIEDFQTAKTKKLQKIRESLRCPVCESERLEDIGTGLRCCGCGAEFGLSQTSYNFLTKDLIEYGNVKPAPNVSANHYDAVAQSIIKKFPNGLILDNGCGLRRKYEDSIVNFEIIDYPTTDVVGIGEKLPFKSNVFDAVFSLAVLEHVKNPFECAREIVRVLKPGGILYIQVPFMQPFHGYPDHYYNMTGSGLKNLFEGDLQILEYGVPECGLPVWCLIWFLNSYIRGLPAPVAEKFKNMKVSELIDNPLLYLEKDFVTQLSPGANEELASANYLIAMKKV
ncbi:MAG: class I SAM-dependent methyltransferase [Oscillatoria princeps RMCB-10]|jgi:SAM-dependent methyltransferase|nr:class I SAM-dependent methyltransferase [Oscillatoria princeps RMCB-10]